MSTTPAKHQATGHLCAFLAMAGFGLMSPFAKVLLADSPMDTINLATLRMIGCAICLLIMLPFLPRQRIAKGDFLPLILMSLFGMALNMYSYTYGVGLTLPSHAGIVTTLPPMFVLILSVLFLKQKMDWTRALGIGIATAGVLTLVLGQSSPEDGQSSILGDMLCLFAQVILACYFVFFLRLLRTYHPFVLLVWLFSISCILSLPFVGADLVHFPWQEMTGTNWFYTLFIVLGTTFVPYLLITVAQKLLQPSIAVCYNYVQPVTALILSLAWGLEVLTLNKMIAIPLIVFGLLIVTQLIRFKRS